MSRKATRQVHRSGFALRLHLAIKEDGLTAEQFARQIDKPLRTVQRWRNGESTPGASDFVLLMRALDRDQDYFYPSPPTEEAA
jgi:transcriptional regulator with XRE-family HTH domain